ncbi:hypothetical protein E2C01_090104 [Portunus trituberculatus]|uniref:Uncharacterized protein n=1 Tax=Portunus trituberculatus TaxID=210409 RepID=A0A5B7JKH7_PORTR|nr:hypothetical protein [Portunus trituberculatus]
MCFRLLTLGVRYEAMRYKGTDNTCSSLAVREGEKEHGRKETKRWIDRKTRR